MEQRGIAEFELEDGDWKLRVRWREAPQPRQEPPTEQVPERPAPTEELHEILSPIVGTYFESAEPGMAPFVSIGDRVGAGQIICVVESMKLMSEITSDVDGIVEELPIENGGPVQAGQVLCRVRTSG